MFPLPGIGDHNAVVFESSAMIQINPPIKRTVYMWSRANLACIQLTATILCDEFLSSNPIHTPVSN